MFNLRKNKHSNQYLQNIYNKYGKESLSFHILEICSKENLNNREAYWVSLMDKDSLFNTGAVGNVLEMTKIVKEKISLKKKGTFGIVANKGKRSITENTANSIREYIMKGFSITDTAKYFNLNHGTIRGIVYGKLYILGVNAELVTDCIKYMQNYKSSRNKSFKHTQESKKEMSKKRKGKNNYQRRFLTDEQINNLRKKYIDGESYATLSREFGLLPQSIRRINLSESYVSGPNIDINLIKQAKEKATNQCEEKRKLKN
jgi:hypothetical protein